MGNGTPFTAQREYAGLIRLSRSNSQLKKREAAAISLAGGEGIFPQANIADTVKKYSQKF